MLLLRENPASPAVGRGMRGGLGVFAGEFLGADTSEAHVLINK